MDKEELTTSQLASFLGVSKLTVHRWCKDREIKFTTRRLGPYEWKFFSKKEANRIKNLIPKIRVIGLPLLPRPKK